MEPESRISFGGYNISKAPKKSKLTWNDIIFSNYWSVSLNHVRVGDYQLKLSTNVAIVDTGTSYLLMPNCNLFS